MNQHKFFLIFFCLLLGFGLIGCSTHKPPLPPTPPIEYVDVEICTGSGMLPNPYCPTREVHKFKKGKEPTSICQVCQPAEVNVCKESGLIPNFYCPEQEVRKFIKGQEPIAICSVHKKPELKKLVYVAAYDLLTATGDKEKFIKTVARAGATGIRIFYLYAWPGNVVSPWKQIGTWKAGYPEAPELPFYDLDQENPDYWKTFREVHRLMKDLDLEVYGVLDDFCSLKVSGWPKYRHPILSSRPDRDPADPEINRLPGGYWGIGSNTIQPYHQKWMVRVVQELHEIGIRYRLERMNEYDALDWPDDHMIEWHRQEIEELIRLGVPKERIIASSGRCWKEIAGQVGVYSFHGFVRPEKVPNYDYSHELILISGDGGFDGAGSQDAKGRRGIGQDQASTMAQKIVDSGYTGYEFLDRSLYRRNNDQANLDDFDPMPLLALVKTFQ